MPKKRSGSTGGETAETLSAIRQLRNLAGQPDEQTTFALSLLSPGQPRDVLQAALQVIHERPTQAARPALHALYDHFAAKQGSRDPGAFMRSRILSALRPMVGPPDEALLTIALLTYEFPPPAFKEEGALLRSTALAALNEVEDRLAAYHAARLLVDEYTDPMSGEPALTAAGLLGAHGEMLPLYAYAMQPVERGMPEVIGECLRQLTALPVELVDSLIRRHGESTHVSVLVGLFDLLIRHREGPQAMDYLHDMLRSARNLDAHYYLATALATSAQEPLIELVIEAANVEQNPGRLRSLFDVFSILEPTGRLAEAGARVRRVLKR
jgi:hypothetical protein